MFRTKPQRREVSIAKLTSLCLTTNFLKQGLSLNR